MRLRQIKLKAWRAAAPATVSVWQDGNAADADASPGKKYDYAITTGAPGQSASTLQRDREFVHLISLKNSYATGKEFVFELKGRRAWLNDPAQSTQFWPNDIVELYAERPDAINLQGGAYPTWHLGTATQGTQQRIFYGFVRSVRQTDEGLEVTCSDARWKANAIILRTALGECDIPRIAFNQPKDSPDYVYNSLKLQDPASANPAGTGTPKDIANERLTVRQVLMYLAAKYRTLLVLHGVQSASLDLIFAAEDLTELSYKMGPLTLQDCGFTDGVSQILQAWAPHLKLVVDHRTGQWRLVQYGPSVQLSSVSSGVGQALGINGPWGGPACSTNDPDFFIVGKRYRFYGGGTFAFPAFGLSQELTVDHVTGSVVYFTGGQPALQWTFVQWKAVQIDEFTMPNVVVSCDDCPRGGVDITRDVDQVFTAIQLWSLNRVTTTNAQEWNRQNLGTGSLQPGWDTTFEQFWTSRDADREMDVGHDGEGMTPFRIGNDGTYDYLEISYGQSQYANRHHANEWKDVSLWVWTSAGVNVKNLKISMTVRASAHVSDVGDGSPGLRITLEASVGGFLYLAGVGFTTSSDKVVLTQNYGLLKTTKGNNKKWEVGRKFYFTDTSVQFDADASPHVSSCVPLRLWEDDGTETPRRAVAMHAGLGYPNLNHTPTGAWETLATGGIGATHVWRRASYTRKPTGKPCAGGAGWAPPKLVQVEVETSTTTVRTARYPLDSYAGSAWLEHAYAAQKDIAIPNWEEDAQTADFAQLAFRLWQRHSGSHHSGQIVKPGLQANAILLDLGVRCSLKSTPSSSQFVGAVGGEIGGGSLESVWGQLTEIGLDFAGDRVTYGFDNAHEMEDLTSEVYEKKITLTSLAQKQADYARAIAQLSECMRGSQTNETPTSVCGERVYDRDNKTILKKIHTGGKAQQEAGASFSGAAHS